MTEMLHVITPVIPDRQHCALQLPDQIPPKFQHLFATPHSCQSYVLVSSVCSVQSPVTTLATTWSSCDVTVSYLGYLQQLEILFLRRKQK